MYDETEIKPTDLKQMLSLQSSIHYNKACEDSKHISILIQGIHDSEKISDKIKSPRFLNDNLAHVLFIIYHALASLSKTFTHYDLHVENVLLVRPSSKKYIRYVYHVDDPITFICPYIPKIIDYGRCFFDNGSVNSKMIYHHICTLPECISCGKYSGFSLLSPHKFLTISSQYKNESHDLRLLHTIKDEMEPSKEVSTTFHKLEKLLHRVKYGKGLPGSYKSYGTIEQPEINYNGEVIENVKDAYYQLMYLITSSDVVRQNETTSDIDGTLHVYKDRPMVYVKE